MSEEENKQLVSKNSQEQEAERTTEPDLSELPPEGTEQIAKELLNKQLPPDMQQRLAFLNALALKQQAQRRGGSHAAHVQKNSAAPGSRAARRMFRRKAGGGGS